MTATIYNGSLHLAKMLRNFLNMVQVAVCTDTLQLGCCISFYFTAKIPLLIFIQPAN